MNMPLVSIVVGNRPLSTQAAFSAPHKVIVEFSKPVHAVRVRIGPPGPNHAPLTDKPSSHHVYIILQGTPPTSHCPTVPPFLLTQNQRISAEIVFFLCDQKCTVGFNWFQLN